MLTVFSPHNYKITIGEEHCMDVEVTANLISCRPPTKEPKDSFENRPRVRVRVLNQYVNLFLNRNHANEQCVIMS